MRLCKPPNRLSVTIINIIEEKPHEVQTANKASKTILSLLLGSAEQKRFLLNKQMLNICFFLTLLLRSAILYIHDIQSAFVVYVLMLNADTDVDCRCQSCQW